MGETPPITWPVHRRQRHGLFRGFRTGTGRHQRRVRRTARGGHLPRRAPERARAVPALPDHRRRAARRRSALCTDAARPCVRRLGSRTRRGRLRLRFRAVNFDRNIGATGWRLDVAPRAGFDWSAPGFFVRPSGGYRYTQYSLEDVAPGTDESPDALAAVRVARRGPRVRTRVRLARPAAAHARAARALSIHAVPRPERSAAIRHRAARPEPRAALSHQPLRRRRPRQRRQPARRRPHHPPAATPRAARNTSP